MDASWVLGQPDFETYDYSLDQNGGYVFLGSSTDGSRLFVADAAHRVLVYDISGGISNNMNASNVLGQADFTSAVTGTTASTFNFNDVSSVEYGDNKLFVSDGDNNRILVFDVSSITNGESAVNVLGQADFTTSTPGTTAGTLSGPSEMVYDSTNDRLFVVDRANVRVLVYDLSGGIVDGVNASNVLGQADFTSAATGTTAARFTSLTGVEYDPVNELLFVSEDNNNRILVFDVSSITNGESAVNVLGQADFVSSGTGTTASTFFYPGGLSYDSVNSRLFAADISNYRMLVFDVSSITNGESAVNVLGQADFVSSATSTGAAAFGEIGLNSYDSTNGYLFVSDYTYNRMLVFDLSTTPTPSQSSTGWNYIHPPLCSATFTPNTITKGESTTLSWNTTWPTDRENNYYTKVPGEGLYSQNVQSLTLQPQHTTEYTIAVFNLWGANFCEATITVLDENGEELTSNQNSYLTAGVSNAPFIKAVSHFFRSLFVK
jgi:hypothetical protein